MFLELKKCCRRVPHTAARERAVNRMYFLQSDMMTRSPYIAVVLAATVQGGVLAADKSDRTNGRWKHGPDEKDATSRRQLLLIQNPRYASEKSSSSRQVPHQQNSPHLPCDTLLAVSSARPTSVRVSRLRLAAGEWICGSRGTLRCNLYPIGVTSTAR